MTAVLPGSSGAFDRRLPNAIMARGEALGSRRSWQPPGTRRHLFKRPDASYPRAMEDMTMKLGLTIGYSGAHLDVPVALVQRVLPRAEAQWPKRPKVATTD